LRDARLGIHDNQDVVDSIHTVPFAGRFHLINNDAAVPYVFTYPRDPQAATNDLPRVFTECYRTSVIIVHIRYFAHKGLRVVGLGHYAGWANKFNVT
jgi:hypothetical protein